MLADDAVGVQLVGVRERRVRLVQARELERDRVTHDDPPADPADAIDALRARYPHGLRHLPADLDADTYLAEQTAALVAWRVRLDSAGADADPREVLAFGYELRSFATFLQDRARRSR